MFDHKDKSLFFSKIEQDCHQVKPGWQSRPTLKRLLFDMPLGIILCVMHSYGTTVKCLSSVITLLVCIMPSTSLIFPII